jgi:hypothetical protein
MYHKAAVGYPEIFFRDREKRDSSTKTIRATSPTVFRGKSLPLVANHMLQGNDVLQSVASVFNKREAQFNPNRTSAVPNGGKLSNDVGPDNRSS